MMCRLPYDHMVSQGSKEPIHDSQSQNHFIIQEDLDLSLMGG